jgi:plastocyanin
MTIRRFHFAPASLAGFLAVALAIVATAASACNSKHCMTRHDHMMANTGPARDVVAAGNTAVVDATTLKNTVVIRNFSFQPATLTVAAGSKVTWTNRDEEPHLVVSAGAQFPASPALDTDDSYETTFAKPGTYTYFCAIHPHMVGTIVVTTSPSTPKS